MPVEWYRAIRRWRELNGKWKTKVGDAIWPGSNEEYLFYQTLVGTWPLLPMDADEHTAYVERIQRYMEKASREAKVHTSWINPNAEYDTAMREFVANTLADKAFLEDLLQFQVPVTITGLWNSISQVVLKVAAPGMPDFYQGNELWSFHLVDPDNRGAVDFEARRKVLAGLRCKAGADLEAVVDRLVAHATDGAIKLYVISRALQLRKEKPELFKRGSYIALPVLGNRARHVVAFARSLAGQTVICLAGRFFLKLCNSHGVPIGDVWGNTAIVLPAKIAQQRFQDVFTGHIISVEQREDETVIPLTNAFSNCPVALLVSLDQVPE